MICRDAAVFSDVCTRTGEARPVASKFTPEGQTAQQAPATANAPSDAGTERKFATSPKKIDGSGEPLEGAELFRIPMVAARMLMREEAGRRDYGDCATKRAREISGLSASGSLRRAVCDHALPAPKVQSTILRRANTNVHRPHRYWESNLPRISGQRALSALDFTPPRMKLTRSSRGVNRAPEGLSWCRLRPGGVRCVLKAPRTLFFLDRAGPGQLARRTSAPKLRRL